MFMLRCVTRWGGGRSLQCPFLKIEKSALILEKGSNCLHSWVESSIQNVVSRVSRRKKLQNVFRMFLTKVYRSALIPQNLPCSEKFLVACLILPIVMLVMEPCNRLLWRMTFVARFQVRQVIKTLSWFATMKLIK